MNPLRTYRTYRRERRRVPLATAFTLIEVLVVTAILVLLAATQLPALTRAKAPVKFTQCMNNCRQVGQSTMLYKADSNDCYPFGNRCYGYGTGDNSVVDPHAWPRQLLRYMGGYKTNVQPTVYVCPSEPGIAANWVFQLHYQANRYLVRDNFDVYQPIRGAEVRQPSKYWMFIEKGPAEFCNIRAGGLANPVLMAWNIPPGFPGYRRHNGGMSSTAADGHVEWLRTPPNTPGRPPPSSFLELGDCASGVNPASTWQDPSTPGNHNGYRVKLYTRYQQAVGGVPPF